MSPAEQIIGPVHARVTELGGEGWEVALVLNGAAWWWEANHKDFGLVEFGTPEGLYERVAERVVPVCEKCKDTRRDMRADYVCRDGGRTTYVAV